jgi:hypothetical protein
MPWAIPPRICPSLQPAGFNVTLAIDAVTDMRAEARDYSIAKVFPRLGETRTTQEIIDLLDKRSA